MTRDVILLPPARAEFDEATDWYARQGVALGERFVSRVNETIKRVGAMPEACQVVYREIRRAVVKRFPYCVYYRVEPDRVVVIAIVHGRRDPSVWQSRA